MRRGPKFRNLGRKVAATTIGDYLVNLDLWVIVLWVTDCFTIMHLLNPSSFPDFSNDRQQCVPLIIDDSPIRESGNQDFQVQITLLRLKDEFHYYSCLQVTDSLDTTVL